jgi:methyl-accepting chemotaxis protein
MEVKMKVSHNPISATEGQRPHPSGGLGKRLSALWSAASQHPVVTGNVFISQEFEVRFILKFCALVVLGSLLFSALTLIYCRGSLTTSFDDGRLSIQQTSLVVSPALLYTSLVVLVLSMVLSIVLTFYFSYRIRKPLFRFREDIKTIADGDISRKIQYRSNDITINLVKNINRMTANFNGRIREMENGLRQTIEAARNDPDVPRELVAELEQLHHRIQDGKTGFRISPESPMQPGLNLDEWKSPGRLPSE